MTQTINRNQAQLLDVFSADDLDQLQPGTSFEVTWTLRNSGPVAWDERTVLAYTDESYPETADYPHSNLAGEEFYTLSQLGAAATIDPGDIAYLTLSFKAPFEPGTYLTGWQLQAAAGERFGPVLELRTVVVQPLEAGVGDYGYEVAGFENSFEGYNNMPAGQEFSGKWTLKNTGVEPWTAAFQVRYSPQSTVDTNDAASDLMGAEANYRLGDLTAQELVAPGETILIELNFSAPDQPGIYAYQWQLVDADGQPFGGTRWLRIVVRQEDGAAPPPPVDTTAYKYSGPGVTFFTGIHGPADDFMWGSPPFQEMMRRLDMPVFFWSQGANPDYAHFGDPSRNAVRLYWNPRAVAAAEAYEELKVDQIPRWWNKGYRRFVFFNEPQFGMEIAKIEEGFGIAWHSADEFGRFLKECLQRARADFPGIRLYTTPMSSNAAFDPWHWRKTMWAHVQGLVDGWCMHAYSGDNANADAAADNIAAQIKELQHRFQLQIPIFVSEASVNRGSDAQQKARVARRLQQKLSQAPGVEGVFWYAADWNPDFDTHHEGWYRNGIADAYLQQTV